MSAGRGKQTPHEPPLVSAGAVVADKYVVESVLGTGAMGYVVAARHKLIGQRVAIKLIKSSYIDDADALERFMREARALVAVQSDNVVRVLDYGTMPDESPYLVMELLNGRDLLAELRARGPLPVGEAAEIIVQACDGLAAVHARGITHRDVKPANLFLTTRANGKLLVKIVDFGISKAPKLSDEELSLTRSSLGSPHYMSPEQLRSARTVDARSDVWSLGVTLHRTLTGELPFAGDSIGGLMAAVMTEQPRPLRELRPELPADLEAIVRRCLSKQPEDRFQGVQELADALTPFAMPSTRQTSEPPSRDDPPHAPTTALRESTTANAHVAQVAGGAPPADKRKRRNVLAAAIGLPLLVASLAIGIAPRSGKPAPPSPAGAASGISVTDLPPPKTMRADAAAAYQAALQAVRDGSFVSAMAGFERAAALDPTMAPAELRCALYGDLLLGADSRRHARTALALRASLTDADRDLLQAIEPLYVPPHPDLQEAERRIDALVLRRPNDAELVFLSAMIFMETRSDTDIIRITNRALEIDPKFAGALWLRALTEMRFTGREVALHSVDQCMALSPAAASCLRVRAVIESAEGQCAALEADARRMVAMEDVAFRAYDYLATALFARGEPVDAVREALRLKWRSMDPAHPSDQLVDEAHLAIATGDFAGAMQQARDLESAAEASGREHDRVNAALLRVELHTELGQPQLAAQVADVWLRRMSAWPGRDSIEDDPRPILEAAAVRGGLRTPDEREAIRANWVTTWKAQVEPLERARVWIDGYAEPASSPEDAQQALLALKDYAPLPSMLVNGWPALELSKVYSLAGRPADALPQLRTVTSSCRALTEPGDFVRARLRLGEALEASGDATGACAAYTGVLQAWGKEKRSVTANTARARATALGCTASPAPPP